MRRRAAAAAIGAGSLVACNLLFGIEEQQVRPEVPDASDAQASAPDGGTAGAAPTACTTDADCVHPGGCHVGTCDVDVGACVYRLCPAAADACLVGRCNTEMSRCEGGARHGFRAGGYALPGVSLGCASAQSCVAAIYPFLFVGTAQDVRAYRVDDPGATTPAEVPLGGVAFRPAQLVASGRRLWILSGMTAGAPPYQLTVTAVDVPSDPTTGALTGRATTFLSEYPSVGATPAPEGDLFLVHNDVARGLPSARLRGNLGTRGQLGALPDGGSEAPSHPMFAVPAPPVDAGPDASDMFVVGSSGARLMAFRPPGTFNPISSPASALVRLEPDEVLQPATGSAVFPRFSVGGAGVVLASFPRRAVPPECNCVTTQRVQWIVHRRETTAIDANQIVDTETYSNPMTGGCNVCAAGFFDAPSLTAPLDATRALLAAPAADPAANRTTTAVRLVTREPLAAPPTRRFTTTATETPRGDFATEKVALTATAGVGFLVRARANGQDARVDVIDPACDAAK
jgi:hypothetical protein